MKKIKVEEVKPLVLPDYKQLCDGRFFRKNHESGGACLQGGFRSGYGRKAGFARLADGDN